MEEENSQSSISNASGSYTGRGSSNNDVSKDPIGIDNYYPSSTGFTGVTSTLGAILANRLVSTLLRILYRRDSALFLPLRSLITSC